MNSALAVAIGLTLAIFLILKKCHPVYALILGAVVSGLASGWGFDLTIKEMFSGVRDISPAIVRILAAGVLTGALVKTGAAENYDATLSSVMAAGIIPALVGMVVLIFVILPLLPDKGFSSMDDAEGMRSQEGLPSFMASITGPLTAVLLMVLRPLFDIAIDPAIALPAGGLVGVLATGKWRSTRESLSYGLEKMSPIAVLLVGTGTIAGVIKASAVKDLLINMISGWDGGAAMIAPVSSILMSAASASTTAGATIASASFAQTVLAAGVNAVWAAAMTNAGATVLDHLPHGSFFHATGGSIGMDLKERLRLIPYESLIGLVLVAMSFGVMLVMK